MSQDCGRNTEGWRKHNISFNPCLSCGTASAVLEIESGGATLRTSAVSSSSTVPIFLDLCDSSSDSTNNLLLRSDSLTHSLSRLHSKPNGTTSDTITGVRENKIGTSRNTGGSSRLLIQNKSWLWTSVVEPCMEPCWGESLTADWDQGRATTTKSVMEVSSEDLLGLGQSPTTCTNSAEPLPEQRQEEHSERSNQCCSTASTAPTLVTIPPASTTKTPNKTKNSSSSSSELHPDSSTALAPPPRSQLIFDSITSLIPPSFTAKCTLPDKTVASQVLMYRQLLHTACKPGLRLSRPFENTKAQRSVMFMPWWEKNVEQTKRMVISYDNLITRVWVYGAILPFLEDTMESHSVVEEAKEEGSCPSHTNNVNQACINRGIDTQMNPETGLPPIPHEFWVTRAGFQQEDPITDFRSGGVLSLAMLLHIVESCPLVHARFLPPHGDASVLPFGITSINVTDMLAKICMFSKSVNKMDALLSSKPFWRMFADPNSLLSLQELSMDMLADAVVELGSLKKWRVLEEKMSEPSTVTVFDFPELMETLERRVREDLLGSGPRDIVELRQMASKLRYRYQKECEKKERTAMKRWNERNLQKESTVLGESTVASVASASALHAVHFLKETAAGITGADGLFSRFKVNSISIASTASSSSSNGSTRNHLPPQATCYQFARPPMEDDVSSFPSSPSILQENIIINNTTCKNTEKDLISF
jgi:hypothetical protein